MLPLFGVLASAEPPLLVLCALAWKPGFAMVIIVVSPGWEGGQGLVQPGLLLVLPQTSKET